VSARDEAAWVDAPDGRIMHFGVQHVVSKTRTWTNPHAATFTDWQARCGASDTRTGGARDLVAEVLAALDAAGYTISR
jgi:hypothetical protein